MLTLKLLGLSKISGFSTRMLGLNYMSFTRNLMVGEVVFSENKDTESKKEPLKKPKRSKSSKKITEEIDNTKFKGSNVLKPFPNNTNPKTGEIEGPRGPEPTRFGDWERKGRVSDF